MANAQRHLSLLKEVNIRKNQNTFAKMQREIEKKRKAENKRQRRLAKKDANPDPDTATGMSDEEAEQGEDADSIADNSTGGERQDKN